MRSEAVRGKVLEGVHDFFVAGGVLGDELISFFGCHGFGPFI
jgi:hypothetical protein